MLFLWPHTKHDDLKTPLPKRIQMCCGQTSFSILQEKIKVSNERPFNPILIFFITIIWWNEKWTRDEEIKKAMTATNKELAFPCWELLRTGVWKNSSHSAFLSFYPSRFVCVKPMQRRPMRFDVISCIPRISMMCKRLGLLYARVCFRLGDGYFVLDILDAIDS